MAIAVSVSKMQSDFVNANSLVQLLTLGNFYEKND